MKDVQNEMAPYPLQRAFIRSLTAAALDQNKEGLVTFWSGQSAPMLTHKKAAELFNSLLQETQSILDNLAKR